MTIQRATFTRPLIAVALVAASTLAAVAQRAPVPTRVRGYCYYNRTVEGLQYPIACRKPAKADGTMDDAAQEQVLLDLNRSTSVVRSTSVMVLSTLIEPRVLPLLATTAADRASRSPAHR